ncbi:MAG: hypothetical protein ACR2MO_14130 [Acidimicrobiales bacterium]
MRTVRPVAALVALALAGGACGGDGSPDAAPSTTVPATAGSTAPGSSTTAVTAEGLRLDLHGLGPVRVGMTLEAAARALGRPLEPVTAPTDECTLYAPASGFDGIAFLVAGGTVARADVSAGATATPEGMAIGQIEAEAQRHYGGRLVVTPHDFQLGGHYLTLVPTEPADTGFRLVAETDGKRVNGMRAGRLPEVELTEGCS